MKKKCLEIFSGTGSVGKVLTKHGWIVRSLDIENKFKPFYNVDIFKWDYKKELQTFTPDFIWASFPCYDFTYMKNNGIFKRDLEQAFKLLNKTLEILHYAQTLNPSLLVVLENPTTKTTKEYIYLKQFQRYDTTYCKYGYWYKKPTSFWSNFKLFLQQPCSKKDPCESLKSNVDTKHLVRMNFTKTENQLRDFEYFSQLRKEKPEYQGWSDSELRYRIPPLLLEDIVKSIESSHNHLEL